jgi:hypothetical protein
MSFVFDTTPPSTKKEKEVRKFRGVCGWVSDSKSLKTFKRVAGGEQGHIYFSDKFPHTALKIPTYKKRGNCKTLGYDYTVQNTLERILNTTFVPLGKKQVKLSKIVKVATPYSFCNYHESYPPPEKKCILAMERLKITELLLYNKSSSSYNPPKGDTMIHYYYLERIGWLFSAILFGVKAYPFDVEYVLSQRGNRLPPAVTVIDFGICEAIDFSSIDIIKREALYMVGHLMKDHYIPSVVLQPRKYLYFLLSVIKMAIPFISKSRKEEKELLTEYLKLFYIYSLRTIKYHAVFQHMESTGKKPPNFFVDTDQDSDFIFEEFFDPDAYSENILYQHLSQTVESIKEHFDGNELFVLSYVNDINQKDIDTAYENMKKNINFQM